MQAAWQVYNVLSHLMRLLVHQQHLKLHQVHQKHKLQSPVLRPTWRSPAMCFTLLANFW
jgi:hypothetical protein